MDSTMENIYFPVLIRWEAFFICKSLMPEIIWLKNCWTDLNIAPQEALDILKVASESSSSVRLDGCRAILNGTIASHLSIIFLFPSFL